MYVIILLEDIVCTGSITQVAQVIIEVKGHPVPTLKQTIEISSKMLYGADK